MLKNELLAELSAKLRSGEVTRQEIAAITGVPVSAPSADVPEKAGKKHITVARVLYFLGAAVVILGIMFFMWQIWNDIGSALRILVTLGLGLVLAAAGSMLITTKPNTKVGDVFHAIGAVLIPGGVMIMFTELRVDLDTVWPLVIAAAVMTVLYGTLTLVHKKSALLTFLALVYATAFVYLLVAALLRQAQMMYGVGDIFVYLSMIVGISHLLLSYKFQNGFNRPIVGVLRFLGAAAFFQAAFTRVFDSGMWQVLFFVLTAGGMALAVHMKSKGVLVVSTLFLVAHFIFITGKYFADSLGWPVSLVFLGLVLIGLGYMSVNINKKYIAANSL